MKKIFMLFGVALLVSWAGLLFAADEMIEESSTGKMFPKQVTVSHEGTDYTLTLTGATVRKKVVVKVYGIAHYMQEPAQGSANDLFKEVLTDGKAKQITMDFARDVSADKIQGAFRDGFKKNTTAAELKEIQPLIDQFIAYYDKADVDKNDQYILRWLPGGVVLAAVKGVEKPAIVNTTFAKALWSIWLGKDSIVDQEKLIERFVTK